MKKSKSKAPKVDPFVEGLMSKLLNRLVELEKKVDRVLAQTAARPSGNGQPRQEASAAPKRDRTLYEAICADCAKVCEVPFRPVEGRAVYCKDCFAKRKGMGHGMPVLTPVALPPKPVSKLGQPVIPLGSARPKKTKKTSPTKKAKKKK